VSPGSYTWAGMRPQSRPRRLAVGGSLSCQASSGPVPLRDAMRRDDGQFSLSCAVLAWVSQASGGTRPSRSQSLWGRHTTGVSPDSGAANASSRAPRTVSKHGNPRPGRSASVRARLRSRAHSPRSVEDFGQQLLGTEDPTSLIAASGRRVLNPHRAWRAANLLPHRRSSSVGPGSCPAPMSVQYSL